MKIQSFLILIFFFSFTSFNFIPELKTCKGKIVIPYHELRTIDMHACCMGFCGTGLKSSSTLSTKAGTIYSIKRITDDDYQTAWVEAHPEEGIGEWISFDYSYDKKHEQSAEGACYYKDEFFFVNGYQRSPKVWKNNNRIKTLRMQIDGKDYCRIELADKLGVQSVRLGFLKTVKSSKKTIKIKFIIEAVYKGSVYNDTALSEIYW